MGLNLLVWGSANSHAAVKPVTGIIYHHVIQLWLMAHLLEGKPSVVCNHNGASPGVNNDVETFLKWQLPERWLGRKRQLAGLPDL